MRERISSGEDQGFFGHPRRALRLWLPGAVIGRYPCGLGVSRVLLTGEFWHILCTLIKRNAAQHCLLPEGEAKSECKTLVHCEALVSHDSFGPMRFSREAYCTNLVHSDLGSRYEETRRVL